jgi:sulfotransferase
MTVRKNYSQNPSVKAQDEDSMRAAFNMFNRFALEGFFTPLTNRPYVIDKSRGWGINYDFLKSFYPNPKIVCMVRDLREILASMENNFRKHPDKIDYSYADKPLHTVNDRVNYWMGNDSKPVGVAYYRLKDIIHRGYYKNMLFIKFEELSQNPEREMKKVYDFLEIPYYAINYEKIKQVTQEDDKFHGIYGDHKIKSKITPLKPKANILLGDELCDRIYQNCKWYFDIFNYVK